MPHYVDGTPAKAGDVVRGKGYNIKDEFGELREFVGVVVGVTPNAAACNVTVLIPESSGGYVVMPRGGENGADAATGYILRGQVEYGQTDHFERVT